MQRILALAFLLIMPLTFCASGIALAQKSPRPKGRINAQEILDKHVAATGGLEALRALQTLHAQGGLNIAPFHSTGDFHFYYKAPASDAFQFDIISHGQSSIGHNEGTPFSKHSFHGPTGINGVTLGILEENCLGLIESGFDKRFTRIELVGLSEIADKWAYVLRFTPALGDRQLRYYDSESFLMLRMDLVQRIRLQKDGPDSAYKVETFYSNYRDSGGINFPRKITANASDGYLVLEIHEVRTNAPVNDSVFRKN